jgi:hypothetical protein
MWPINERAVQDPAQLARALNDLNQRLLSVVEAPIDAPRVEEEDDD